MKISVVVPFHWMEHWQGYLNRCLKSIENQSFKDYEVILMKVGSMPITTNRVMEAAKGDLVKILYMDDYLAHGDSLKEIVDNIGDSQWLVTGCLHEENADGHPKNYHSPRYNPLIHTGQNTIGSPSVLTMKRGGMLFFDEHLSWLLDCDLYKRLHDTYGPPKILDTPNVTIGLHRGQTSNLMPDELKAQEHEYLSEKYGTLNH